MKTINIVYYTNTNGGLGGCEILKSSTIVCGLTCCYLSRCGFGWSAGLLACWPADCAETYEDLKLHKPDRQHAKSRVFMEREYQSSETERVNVKN